MRFTQRMFGSLMLITTYILAPLEIIMTGQHESLNSQSVAPIIANQYIILTVAKFILIGGMFGCLHGIGMPMEI